jgi:hypothetical protein
VSLYRISTKYYSGGLITNEEGKVVHAAPIVQWTKGLTIDEVKKWAISRDMQVKVEVVNEI